MAGLLSEGVEEGTRGDERDDGRKAKKLVAVVDVEAVGAQGDLQEEREQRAREGHQQLDGRVLLEDADHHAQDELHRGKRAAKGGERERGAD